MEGQACVLPQRTLPCKLGFEYLGNSHSVHKFLSLTLPVEVDRIPMNRFEPGWESEFDCFVGGKFEHQKQREEHWKGHPN